MGQQPSSKLTSKSSLHEVTTPWKENNTNWKKPWKMQGGDFNVAAIGEIKNETKNVKKWHSFTVTKQVVNMITGEGQNNGFILIPSKAGDSDASWTWNFYRSSEYSELKFRPKLVIKHEKSTHISSNVNAVNKTLCQMNIKKNLVYLKFKNSGYHDVSIFTTSGKIVYNNGCISKQSLKINKTFSSGVYLLRVVSHTTNGSTIIPFKKRFYIQ